MKYLSCLVLLLVIFFTSSLSFARHIEHHDKYHDSYTNTTITLGTISAVQNIILGSMAIQNGYYQPPVVVKRPVIIERTYRYHPDSYHRSGHYRNNVYYHPPRIEYHHYHSGGPYYGGNGRRYYDN